MDALLARMEARFGEMFTALAAGADVAPSLRLRTEGLMEAAVVADVADQSRIDALLADCYHAAFNRRVEDDFGADWRAFYPFPQVPAVGRRAPVYPSTSD